MVVVSVSPCLSLALVLSTMQELSRRDDSTTVVHVKLLYNSARHGTSPHY